MVWLTFSVVKLPRPAAVILVLGSLLFSARAQAQTRLFAVDGTTLTTTGDSQNSTARPIPDGGTGVYYTWLDLSNATGGGASIYVTHLSSTGALASGWPTANGGAVQVISNANDSGSFDAASDGNGGIVILWSALSGSVGIYGQRINSSGAIVWTSCGVAPCGVAMTAGNSSQEFGFGTPYVLGTGGSQEVMFAHGASPVSTPGGYFMARKLTDGTVATGFTGNSGFGVLITTFSTVATGGSNLPQTAFGVNASTLTLTGNQNNGQPILVADTLGGAFVVYDDPTSGVNQSSSVFVTHLSSAGAVLWGPVSVSSAVSDNGAGVQASADGNGGVVVFYNDPGGIGYAQRLNGSGVKQWNAGGVKFYTGPVGYTAPVAVNSSILIYGAGDTPTTTIYGRGLNTADGSAAFSVAMTTVSSQFDAAFVASPAGGGQANPGVIFLVSNNLNGSQSDIYAYRVDSTGAKKWSVVLSNAAGDKGFKGNNGGALGLDADGSGGVYAAWISSQSGPGASLYGARLTVDGALASGWTTSNGVLLANTSQAGNLSLAASGANGFLAAWTNNTGNSSQSPVFVQQVTASGVTNLGSSGRQVGTGSTFSSQNGSEGGSAAVLVSGTAAPQFMVSWSSSTGSGLSPVLTQAFDASGNQLFAGPGIQAVRDVPNRQVQHLQSLGTGKVVVLSWQENGATTFDFTQAISTFLPPTGTQSVQPALVVAPSPSAVNPGYVVVYAQNLSTSPYASIVAAKCDVSGTIDWTTLVTNSQYTSVLDPTFNNDLAAASDGSGGVYVLWASSLSTPGGEVYASYLTSLGALGGGWTPNGTRIAYGNNSAHLTVAGASAGMIAAWTNGINGEGGPNNPVYDQIVSTGVALKFSAGSSPAAPGGSLLGVGQTQTNSAAVTNPTAASANLFVAWQVNNGGASNPVKVQAYDASGNALFGSGYQAVQHAGTRGQNNGFALGAGNDLALGWSEGTGPVSLYSQFITTAIIGPVAPSSPTITSISSSSFFISWGDAPQLATGYELDVSSDPTFVSGVTVSTYGATVTSASVSGLLLNTSWYAEVGSLSVTQPARYANATPFPAVTLAPSVTSFLLVSASSTSIKANWLPYTFGQAAGYRLDASTAANFTGTVISSVSYGLNPSTLTLSGVIPNTTYYLRVGELNSASTANFVSEGSTATAATLPFVAGTVTSSTTATFSWGSANGAGTQYRVDLSTDQVTTNSSVFVTTTSATFTGLASNTTYYGQVTVIALSGPNAGPVNLTTAITQAAAPAALGVTVFTTSATLNWSANGNSTNTVYTAQFSTNSFASILGSASTTTLSASQNGLLSNATFYARVFATNAAGFTSTFTVLATTATNPASPVAANPAAVSANSITAFWVGGTNAPGTAFLTQISTDGFASVNSGQQSTGTSAAFNGLSANTAYNFRVFAIGQAGVFSPATVLPSTSTALLPPAVATTTFLSVGSSSAAVQWASGGNGAGTTYVVQVSTDNLFGSVYGSSTTLSTSAVLGTATALNPNTTYYFRVESSTTANNSVFVALGSTITPPAQPTAAAQVFTSVGAGVMTVNWSSGSALAGFNGPSTVYQVQLSTSAGFVPVVSATTTALANTFSGLIGNTVYFSRVAAFGSATGSYGAFVSLGSTATLTAPPGAASFSGVNTASVTANWTANGDPAGTQYQVQLSTDPAFGGVIFSSNTVNLTAPIVGLTPNTTYYGQAAAFSINTGTFTAYTALGSVTTLAAAPTGAAVSLVTTVVESLSWGANGNPAGTSFTAQISTSAGFVPVLASSVTVGTTATFTGLSSNTTYFLRVEAVNSTGTVTAFAVAAASSTQASAPLSAPLTSVTTNSVTANWTSADAPATQYIVQSSTNGFATVNASSQTRNLAAVFSGLLANTNYNFQVAALGNDGTLTAYTGLPSTSTLLLPPSALVSSATFVAVSTYSAQVAWGSGGNGAGTTYVAQISTDNFATTNTSSSTLNLSALFGQGGQGATLAPNTTYYFRVQTSTTGNASAFVGMGSTITPVNAPLAAAFSGVGLTGLTANWTANSNPGSTLYQVQVATTAGFSAITASTQTLATTAAFNGLTSNATFYARVASFSSALGAYGAYTALGSTATTAPAPSASAFTAVSTGAATANWTANANPAGTVYAFVLAADPAFADAVQPTAYTTNLNAVLSGLTPNTSYYGEVAAYSVNSGTYTAFTNLGALWTLANAPASPAVSAASTGSITVGWTANGDPAGTQFVAQLSTSAGFGGTVLVSSTVATSAAFGGLNANTTYYTRVEAFNSSGTASAFALAAASSTVAAPPVLTALAAVTTNSVTANWTSADAAGTVYIAQISTDGFVSVNSSLQTAALLATFPGLASNTAYTFRVAARGNDGSQTPYSGLVSTSTLLLPPATAGTTFVAVSTYSAQIAWASGGNGAGTTYVAQVSTDNFATTNTSSSTLNLGALFGLGGQGAGLAPNTTYYFRVQTSTTGNASAFVSLGSTITPVNAPLAAAFSGVGLTGLTANWTANSNPGSTLYQVQVATTVGFSAITASTQTLATTAAFNGLTSNATFYARVASFSSALGAYGAYTSLGSTATTTSAPLASAFTAVSTGNATANWTANGNPAGTVYAVVLAADAAFTDAVQPTVYTSNLNTVLTGLTANTSYYGEVAAYSVNSGTYTAFTNLGALWTLANAPASPAVSAVSTGSVTVGWTANGDPAGTQYVAQLSTSAGFGGTVLVSSTVATSAAFGGLNANTTYYTRVEAFNSSGTASAFAVSAATSTQASAPVTAAPTAVTTNSVTANWTAADAAGTVYTAQISTDGFATVNASAQTAALTTTFSGLASNTSYNFRVAARGNDGTLTAYTTLPSTSTLLLPPLPLVSSATFVSVSTIGAQIAWGSGGNGAGTTYVAQVSTDNFATTNTSSSTLNLGALFGQGGQGATLAPNTTYYFRVQTSTTGNASAFVSLGSTITPVNAPLAAAFSGVGTAVLTANWTANGDPSGTQYQVQIATTPGFVAIAAAQATTGTAFGFTSLSANTTYYGRVAAFSSALGAYGSYTALGSTATTTSSPLASAFTAVSSGSATANWTANGNPAGTVYALVLAADAAFADAVSPTVYTSNLNTVLTGLTANTSYYGEVAAYSVNTATYTAFTNLGALWTLANTPASPAVSAASTGSITVGWTANGNPGGTQYVAQLSTNAGFGGTVLISSTVATSTAFGGLAANTTYFARIEAFNSSGTATAFALAAASSTVAAAPVPAVPTGISTGSVVANWSANGDAATTVFVAQISADGFTTVAATVTAPATSAAFTGLSANTAYAFRVAAKGNDGTQTPFVALPSTSTLLLPPATTTTIFVNVTTAAAQIAWGNGGNGAGTTYVAQISTDNFADLLASSSTLNTGAVFGGLGPNTTYYFQVKTTTTGNSSAFVPLGSTVTPSFAPTGTAVLSVTSTTVVTSWSANGNPVGTTYELWRDLTGAFSAPVKTIVSTTNFTTNSLAPNTTYFYQVRTLGFGGAYTGFDTAVSTATLPPAPGVPGTPAGFALGTTSVSWNWSAATFANSYKVYRAASLVQLASTSTLAYFDAALATNTAYGLVVGGINATGAGPLSPSATLYTLAAPPAGTAAGIVAATSATLSWSLNTNPVGTLSEVQRSSDGVVYASQVSSVSTAGYTDTSLIGCTSYYYKVRNINGNGLPTGFDAPVQIFTANTIPAAASGLTATASGGNRIALSWTASPTEGITAYDVYYDSGTGVVSYGAPLATVPSTMTAYTSAVLTSSGAYVFAVRAKHRCGVEENNGVFATATATATVAALRAAIQTPSSGHHVDGNSLSVVAGLTSGSQSSVAQIRFQYRVSGSTNAWIDMVAADANHPNPALSAPYFIHWNVSGLTAGGYDLRSVASDISGSTDTAADIVSVAIDHATPDTTENLSGGQVTRTQTFNTAITNSFFTGGDNTGDPLIKIVIPPAAVSGTTVSATVLPVAPLSLSTNPPAGFAISGNLVMRITLNNGQSSFLGGNTAQITFGYSGTLGTAPQIWSLNENTGVWANDCANAVVDTVNRTISCNTTHFTVFAVLTGGAAAADLSGVRAYPVPYKPNGSDKNQGGGNTGIFFDRMPASASIKIYTAQGRLVTSFDASSPTGKVVWDARNGDGRDVATGLYVAIISSPGQKPVTKKLLIVR
jgi:hypothetical protein